MPRFQPKIMSHAKKQENMACIQEKREKKLPQEARTLDLLDTDFISTL